MNSAYLSLESLPIPVMEPSKDKGINFTELIIVTLLVMAYYLTTICTLLYYTIILKILNTELPSGL